MRIVKEIPHSQLKITLFFWNGKYLIKLEAGMYEQTYKVSEQDVMGDEEITKMLDEAFLLAVMDNFKAMHSAAKAALNRI
jgi:hypothetical protein